MTRLPLWLSFRALSEELDFVTTIKVKGADSPFLSLSSENNTVAGELAEGETNSQSCKSIILCYTVFFDTHLFTLLALLLEPISVPLIPTVGNVAVLLRVFWR